MGLKNKKDKNDKIYATSLDSFGGEGGSKYGILENVFMQKWGNEKRNPEYAGDAGCCASFWTKEIVHGFCLWHDLVFEVNSWIDVFHGGVQIRTTANFLLDEFVDEIGVLSWELGGCFLCGSSMGSSRRCVDGACHKIAILTF
jgi:hypothetical protein